MKLSLERVSFLAREMTKRLKAAEEVDVRSPSTQVTAAIIRSLREVLSKDEEIERTIRQKIRSLSRRIPEGTSEWHILFRQYYEEELQKMGSVGHKRQ